MRTKNKKNFILIFGLAGLCLLTGDAQAMHISEGILPALESSHAVAKAMEVAAGRKPDEVIVVCLSGRGDKDAAEIARLRGEKFE